MHETAGDVEWLQGVLVQSYARAGEHLRSVTTPARRISAAELSALLPGVQIIDVATVTADGRPRIGPVDGLFFRGRFYFGSSTTSLRYRHLRARPQVNVAHTRSETLSVIVHGTARLFALGDADRQGFPDYCYVVYVPRYGEGWKEFAGRPDIFYAKVEPEVMFTFRMDEPRLP